MADAQILSRIKEVLAGEWGIDANMIPDEATLNGFQRWDSLGHITIMLALSDRFDFALTAEIVQDLRSLPGIVEFLRTRTGTSTEETSHEPSCASRA